MSWQECVQRSRYGFTCFLDFGTLALNIRRDTKYFATVSLGDPFLALEENAVSALAVSVEGEKMHV